MVAKSLTNVPPAEPKRTTNRIPSSLGVGSARVFSMKEMLELEALTAALNRPT